MKEHVRSITHKGMRIVMAGILACGMMVGSATQAFASEISWDLPASTSTDVFVKDGQTYRYLSAVTSWEDHEALEYMGVDDVAVFSRKLADINTTDSTSETYYNKCQILGVFGSAANINPNPYLVNLFYNYAVEAGDIAGEKSTAAAEVVDGYLDPAYAIESDTGVTKLFKYRPDIMYPDEDGDLIRMQRDVKNIQSFDASSPYFKAQSETYVGDNNYDPTIAYREETGYSGRINNMYTVADSVEDTIAREAKLGVHVTTRYGEDVQKVARDYELYVRGMQYYVMSQIAAGKVAKKKVYVIESVSEDGTIIAWDMRNPDTTSRYCDWSDQGSAGIVENLGYKQSTAGQGDTSGSYSFEITIDQLAQADVLLMETPDNSGMSNQMARRNYDSTVYAQRIRDLLVQNNHADKANIPIYTTDGNIVMSNGYNGHAGCSLIYGWVNSFIYPEVLNTVHLTEWFYEKFYHLTSSAMTDALTMNLEMVSFPEGQGLEDISSYSASEITSKLETGMKYYLQNEAAIVADRPELQATDQIKEAYSYLLDGEGSQEPSTPASGKKVGDIVKAGSGAAKAEYKIASASTAIYNKAAVGSAKKATVPATVKIDGKSYKVTGIAKQAFKGSKVATLTVKTSKLTKKSVKGSLKASKVKTVKVPKAKLKAYKKAFAKGNCGKKVTVKK